MRIYFAAPLFSQAEKMFNTNLTAKLEELGFEVFLPQRDGIEKDVDALTTMPNEELGQTIFEIDKDAVFKADILLFVLDGRVPDEGAAVELGIAYAHKVLQQPDKRLIGLMTDERIAFPQWKLNPMLLVPLEYIAENEEDLLTYLQKKILQK